MPASTAFSAPTSDTEVWMLAFCAKSWLEGAVFAMFAPRATSS
jgi:hypothetical protein